MDDLGSGRTGARSGPAPVRVMQVERAPPMTLRSAAAAIVAAPSASTPTSASIIAIRCKSRASPPLSALASRLASYAFHTINAPPTARRITRRRRRDRDIRTARV